MNRRLFLSTASALLFAVFASPSAFAADGIIPGFSEASAAGVPVLVHVTAPWCEVCQAQKPIVAKLVGNDDFASMKKFDIDFDSQKDVLQKLRVQSQSTMVLFKNGKEIDRMVGVSDPAEIEAFLRKAIENGGTCLSRGRPVDPVAVCPAAGARRDSGCGSRA